MHLDFHASKEALPSAVSFVDAFVESHAVSMSDAMALQLIVEELVTNVIVHGGLEGDAPAGTFTLDAEAEGYRITLTDRGRPFDPLAQATPDLALSLEERDIGGLGIHLCRRLTEQQRYERRDGHNVLTLLRRRSA